MYARTLVWLQTNLGQDALDMISVQTRAHVPSKFQKYSDLLLKDTTTEEESSRTIEEAELTCGTRSTRIFVEEPRS